MPKERFKDLIAGKTRLSVSPDKDGNLPPEDVWPIFNPSCGRDFQIGRVTANNGNWIVLQLLGGRATDETIFTKIQNYLFNIMSVYKDVDGKRIPMRIYDEGSWLVKELDLEYDLDTVNMLYTEALAFNFNDFFVRSRKEEKDLEAAMAQVSSRSRFPTT